MKKEYVFKIIRNTEGVLSFKHIEKLQNCEVTYYPHLDLVKVKVDFDKELDKELSVEDLGVSYLEKKLKEYNSV